MQALLYTLAPVLAVVLGAIVIIGVLLDRLRQERRP